MFYFILLFFITHHSLLNFCHSSLITYHLKYPNSLLSTCLAPSLGYVVNQKTKKNGTIHWPNVISFYLSFFFFLSSPDSHLSLPLISVLSASYLTFLSPFNALLSPISRRRWQRWRWWQIPEVWTRRRWRQLKTSPLWVLLAWVLGLDQCFSEGLVFWFLIMDFGFGFP